MNSKKHNSPLEKIPANNQLVEDLYAHGKISKEARDYALELISPRNQWGLWVSRLLLTFALTFILLGIVFFFAFNWDKMTPLIKISSIELGIVLSVLGAYFYSLDRPSGQMFLLCATVFVGVFMAVFGQIYQTGVDAYQLFMTWSLLTFGWTLISSFLAQWALWLTITNLFLLLWWEQAIVPTLEVKDLIYIYLSAFNGLALVAHEYFSLQKGYGWLNKRWSRDSLLIVFLFLTAYPITTWILAPNLATPAIILSSLFGIVGQGAAYYTYRYKLSDARAITFSVFSICLLLEYLIYKLTTELFWGKGPELFLILGLLTVGLFSSAAKHLHNLSKKLETNYA